MGMSGKDSSNKLGSFVKKQGIIILFVIVTLALLGSTMYFYTQYQKISRSEKEKPDEVSQLIARAGAHILLPDGEVPKIVTVTDRDKLSDQVFFTHAKNGDKVLVYEGAKKAFLYDPKADIILEVGPVTINDIVPSATVSAQIPMVLETPTITPRTYRFVLYNGTGTTGLTKTYETELTALVQDAIVIDRDNAAKRDYLTSVIVDLSGSNVAAVAGLAKTLGLEASSLPAGEIKPADADFLIILGADKK